MAIEAIRTFGSGFQRPLGIRQPPCSSGPSPRLVAALHPNKPHRTRPGIPSLILEAGCLPHRPRWWWWHELYEAFHRRQRAAKAPTSAPHPNLLVLRFPGQNAGLPGCVSFLRSERKAVVGSPHPCHRAPTNTTACGHGPPGGFGGSGPSPMLRGRVCCAPVACAEQLRAAAVASPRRGATTC